MKKQYPPTLKVTPIFTLLMLYDWKKKNLERRCLQWKKERKKWKDARFIQFSTSLNKKETMQQIQKGKNMKAIALLAQVSAGLFASPKLWIMVVLGQLLSVRIALAQLLRLRRSGYCDGVRSYMPRSRQAAEQAGR